MTISVNNFVINFNNCSYLIIKHPVQKTASRFSNATHSILLKNKMKKKTTFALFKYVFEK